MRSKRLTVDVRALVSSIESLLLHGTRRLLLFFEFVTHFNRLNAAAEAGRRERLEYGEERPLISCGQPRVYSEKSRVQVWPDTRRLPRWYGVARWGLVHRCINDWRRDSLTCIPRGPGGCA